MLKLLVLSAFVLLSFISSFSEVQAKNLEPIETRGLWVVRGEDLLTEDRIDRIIQIHEHLNMNTIFVQVNGRGEAYYHSDILPIIKGVSREFDPLQMIIDKAHQK